MSNVFTNDRTANSPAAATPSRLANLKNQLGAVDDLIISSVLKSTATGSVAGSKEPLSLQQTSNNFKKFVQKSGPIFVAQDAAEAVLRWEDGSQTIFFAVVWGFICWYPYLLLLVPNVFLAAVLLSTHPSKSQSSSGGQLPPGTPLPAPPAEGSIDYLANLQNIQIMMGRISDLSDAGRAVAPYLTWRDERISLLVLQLSVLSGALLLLAAPYIPWRLVMLIGGETTLFAGHPWARPLLMEIMPYLQASGRHFAAKGARLLEDDALEDDELDAEIFEVERLEVETRQDGIWVPDVIIGGELPKGSRWLRMGDWAVDPLYAAGQVDEAGFLYLHLDGSTSASPAHASGPFAQSRRRRWVRRAARSFV